MSDEPKLADLRPPVPLYAQGDIVQHKTSKQSAVVLSARDVIIHDKSCPNAQPFQLAIRTCDCAATFTGEYTVSTDINSETIVDECVLEPA